MFNFVKKFFIQDDDSESNKDLISLTSEEDEKYDSPVELNLKKQLQKDELDTWDSDDIEAQYIDGQITNLGMDIPDPIVIKDRIKYYRGMSENHYIDDAVDTIKNEVIIEENQKIVSLDLTNCDLSENIRKKIQEEFDNTLKILNFRKYASQWFERFYVDGRQYFRMVFDSENFNKGVIGVQELDSIHIQKFYSKQHDKIIYQYTDIEDKQVAISENAIIALTSGKINADRTMFISFLDQAIKPYNLLTLLVDAMAIYRITRAPERRVFNISTGRMAPKKAKQYVQQVINALKTNLTYNSSDGSITQQHRSMTMVEDFYFPKGQDDKGTSVDTLTGGQQLGEITDIEFLERNLLKSLKIPMSRLDSDSTMNSVFGNNTSDIEKEENRFSKFINYLRYRFRDIIIKPFRLNLIIKKIITPEEWDKIEQDLDLIWTSDSHVAELKFLEKLEKRADAVEGISEYVGKIFSQAWVNSNIWKMTDEDIEEQRKQIEEEKKQGIIDNESGEDDE